MDANDFENMLLDCQIALKPNLLSRLVQMLNTNKGTSVKLNLNNLRTYFDEDSSSTSAFRESHNYDYEPSLERPVLSEETTQEEISIIKSGARKLLTQCHA